MIGVSRGRSGRGNSEKTMKSPLFKIFTWAACLAVMAGVSLFLVPKDAEAAATLAVPEPAMLLLLGVGLSAVAMRVRSRRRP